MTNRELMSSEAAFELRLDAPRCMLCGGSGWNQRLGRICPCRAKQEEEAMSHAFDETSITVEQLIEQLQAMPKTARVIVHCNEDWSINGDVHAVAGTPAELQEQYYCAGITFKEYLPKDEVFVLIKGYSGGD